MPLDLSVPPALMQQYLSGAADENSPEAIAKKKGIDPRALAVFLGGAGADIGSTAYALAQPNSTMHEANPLISHLPQGAMLPVGAAMEGGAMAIAAKLLKNHPKAMNALLIGTGALHGGLAVNNVRQIKQGK